MEQPEGRDPGARVVSAGRVRESAARAVVPIPGHEHAEEARVELVREGGVVRAIDFTCSCGKRYRVLCDYEGTEGG